MTADKQLSPLRRAAAKLKAALLNLSGDRRRFAVLPLLIAVITAVILLMPGTDAPKDGVNIRMISVPDFPIVLALEQENGTISSAWIRTPAGTRELSEIEGLTYISDAKYLSNVDQDKKNDLMWRLSFIDFQGDGVHLWLGITTWAPKLFISSSPYQYTRWDAVPAKLVVPKGTAVYVSPATPSYNKSEAFTGRNSYSFVYTVRMTADGPAFVPVPSVYKQLATLLRAGIQGEFSPMKRLTYVRMLNEFNGLAEGKPPQAETMINFQMQKVDTITWKK